MYQDLQNINESKFVFLMTSNDGAQTGRDELLIQKNSRIIHHFSAGIVIKLANNLTGKKNMPTNRR